MRVIAGISKGRKLKVPKRSDIRPITGNIKEALFNTIGPYLEGKTFLDLSQEAEQSDRSIKSTGRKSGIC